MGATGDDVQAPVEWMSSRDGSGDGSATAADRQGITLVVGGAAAAAFESCEPNLEASVWPGVSYDNLSPVERTAIVESVSAQLLDRQPQYGTASEASDTEAIDIAASMTFTIVEPSSLEPSTWEMEGAAPQSETAPTDSDAEAGGDDGMSRAAGWNAYFQCDVSFEAMWSSQTWGKRFELPALAVAAPVSEELTHTVARLGVARSSELSSFAFSSQEGFQSRIVEENWAGLNSERSAVWGFSESRPVVAMPDVTMLFSSMASASSRDVSLFFAGVMLSLFASLLVASIRQILSRRR
jgi:hypothetical protein